MQRKKNKHRRFFVGQTGEYYVLFRLSESELLATLAPPNSPHIDILVSDLKHHELATIQVKTRDIGNDGGWCLKGSDANFVSDNHFFVFVDLGERVNGGPATYVVPSKVVSDLIRRMQSNDKLLRDVCQGSLFHKDPSLRASKPSFDLYQLVQILRDPPPELTKHWMVELFLDAYFLINKPLLKYKPRRRSEPSNPKPPENRGS